MTKTAHSSWRFPGMHADERVLYAARHHPIRMVRGLLYSVGTALAVYLVASQLQRVAPDSADVSILRAELGGYFLSLLMLAWVLLEYFSARVFITDRRIMRLELSPAGYIKKRGLFWNDVAKTKSWHRNIILRWFNIGTVKITPTIYFNEEIRLPDMYYFEDLANYIDKIVYTYRTTPDKLSAIRPFVTKPKWKRYPLDGTEGPDVPKRLRRPRPGRRRPQPSDNADAAGNCS